MGQDLLYCKLHKGHVSELIGFRREEGNKYFKKKKIKD